MKISRKALILVFMAFFLYQASINTQSGWQYLITAATISFIIIGVILPRLYIKNISVDKSLEPKLYACQPSKINIKFTNNSNKTRKYINFEDIPLSMPLNVPQITSDTLISNIKSLVKKIIDLDNNKEFYFINIIPPKSSVSFTCNFIPKSRGVFKSGSVKLFSNYPFGILTLSKQFRFDQNIVVYPKYHEVRAGWISRLLKSDINTNTSFIYQPTSIPANTRNLREYVTGDSPRHIHWPSSAKTNKLLVREFEIPTSGHILILLDSRPAYSNPEYFELAVTTAASLLNSCHKRALITRFFTQCDSYSYDKAYNNSNWIDQLELLARVKPVSKINMSELKRNSLDLISLDSHKNNCFTVIISSIPYVKDLNTNSNIINITISKNKTGFEHYNISDEKDLMVI